MYKMFLRSELVKLIRLKKLLLELFLIANKLLLSPLDLVKFNLGLHLRWESHPIGFAYNFLWQFDQFIIETIFVIEHQLNRFFFLGFNVEVVLLEYLIIRIEYGYDLP